MKKPHITIFVVNFLFTATSCSKADNLIDDNRVFNTATPTATNTDTVADSLIDDNEVSSSPHILSEIIQGQWGACQVYDHSKECVEIGQIIIQGDSYSFQANPDITGPSIQGTLDFLFDEPNGKVIIDYSGDVKASDTYETYSNDDILAVVTFESDSGKSGGAFLIRVGINNSLYFHSLISEVSMWGVSKGIDD